ncbi:hypothetical protein [Campylobacter mucosalis]|uniref:hypothetical protein n=1 Tax=Campylobacter mucosalis TaxID=202 RepID=UPI00147003DC|nr:hypothetical protein [Campylobacter mucosalis]
MRKIINFITILVFFVGCASKEVIHEPIKNEALAYTSKAEIIKDSDRVLVIATYLNPISKEKIGEDTERFLLAINPKESDIVQQSITVNDDKNVMIREISDSDELMEFASFKLPWARYYEISTPKKEAKTLKLTFEIYQLGQVALEFVKVSKSLYWNP